MPTGRVARPGPSCFSGLFPGNFPLARGGTGDTLGLMAKLGILISSAPDRPAFRHGVRFAEAALGRGLDVYLYCLDDAVSGVRDADLQGLKAKGLKLYACAYGAHQRGLPVDDSAAYAGLTVVSDLVAGTDRFVSFD